MKKGFWRTALAVAALAVAVTSVAAAEETDLDRRVDKANDVMKEIMNTPDQSIPEELLAKCKAIAIYPSVLKGSFIFGARWGKGVVLRRDERSGKWSPVAFSTIGGGSWGLQIGAQATDLILVIMNNRGLEGLLSNNFTLGADASVAAGPVGRSTSAATDLFLKAGIISYSRSRGVFGGVALDGSVLTQDNNSNTRYYGKPINSRQILLDRAVEVKPSSIPLTESLEKFSQRWAKRMGASK